MTQQHIVYVSGKFNGVPETGWHGPFPNEWIAHKYARAITGKPGGRMIFVRVEPLKTAAYDHLIEYEDPRPALDESQAPPKGWDVVDGGAVHSDEERRFAEQWNAQDERERQHAALCVAAARGQP